MDSLGNPVSRGWARKESSSLLALAGKLQPEGEGLDLTDQEYSTEEMVELRSYLSSMRRNIDLVNKALAKAWAADHKGKNYDDGYSTWYVAPTKGKRVIDPDTFYAWMASLTPTRLSKVISATAVKVGGMTPAERETFLDEEPTSEQVSIQSKPNK
jgi:hypothetical protein